MSFGKLDNVRNALDVATHYARRSSVQMATLEYPVMLPQGEPRNGPTH